MEWWTSPSAAAAAAVVANDLGNQTGGQADQTTLFDPWLNVGCDELDLSIILSQHPHHVPTQLSTFCENSNIINQSPMAPASPHRRVSSTTMFNNSTIQSQTNLSLRLDAGSSEQSIGRENLNYVSLKTDARQTVATSPTTCSTPPNPIKLVEPNTHLRPLSSSSAQKGVACDELHQGSLTSHSHTASAQSDRKPISQEASPPAQEAMTSSGAGQFSHAVCKQSNQHNSLFGHLLSYNSTTFPSQSAVSNQMQSANYSSRPTLGNKMHFQNEKQQHQMSYLSCSSAASPITSCSVSSSVADQFSPQNSVELSSNGTPTHTCYSLGSNYPVNMLSPPSLINASTISKDMDRKRSNEMLSMSQSIGDSEFQVNFNRDSVTQHNQGLHQNEQHSENHADAPLPKEAILKGESFFARDSARSDRVVDTYECVPVGNDGNKHRGFNRRREKNNQEDRLHSSLVAGKSSAQDLDQDDHLSNQRATLLDPQDSQLAQSNSLALDAPHTQTGVFDRTSQPSCSQGTRQRHKWADQSSDSLDNNNTRAARTTGGQKSARLRRCRHITDYVLADEEKRLLIKEGYTDFPMTSSPTRPLSRSEERILRKIRRKIRNKKSAQCSRQRKKEYVEELERKYTLVARENEELKQLLKRIQQQAN